MSRRGRYYLSRVVKLGQLTQETFCDALIESPVWAAGKFAWNITDVVDARKEKQSFIFGKLAKFSIKGHVPLVDLEARKQYDAEAKNLLIASSPFIYLPDYSGFCYMHVWNDIQEDIFPRRIKAIVEKAHNNFFAECEIEPIVDYRAFSAKLKQIARFTELSAKVHPPNPMFGKLWGPLKEYVKNRNASEVAVRESSTLPAGVKTELPKFVDSVLTGKVKDFTGQLAITDAAMLMAADGYGSGKVIGDVDGEEVVIRTSETQKSFLFEKEPKPTLLAAKVRELFEKIKAERKMGH